MAQKMTRKDVYALIDGERDYQDNLLAQRIFDGGFGGPSDAHSVGAYITMLSHYVNKLQEAWTTNKGDQAALEVMRKCAGIAVHCMEDHGAPARVDVLSKRAK